MALTEAPVKVAGHIEVLFHLSDNPVVASLDDFDWDDYMMVWPLLPAAEFRDPMDILEALLATPPKYGPLPRPPRELDIIQLCPNNRYRDKTEQLTNCSMMIVNAQGSMQRHLQCAGTVINTSRMTKGLGLMIIPITKPSFFLTQPNSFNRKKN